MGERVRRRWLTRESGRCGLETGGQEVVVVEARRDGGFGCGVLDEIGELATFVMPSCLGATALRGCYDARPN